MLWEWEDFPHVPWEQFYFTLFHLNMNKQEEHEQYEVHSLRERYNQLKVESSQPSSQPTVGREQAHGIQF